VKQSNLLSAIAAVLLSTAACSGGVSAYSRPADSNDYDDVAQAIASVVATTDGGGEVGSLSDSVDLAEGVMPSGVSCNTSGNFAANRLGLDYQYQLRCKNAAGATLAACGRPAETADAKVDWSGYLGLPDFSASLQRQTDWSLSGIPSDTVRFAGDGTFAFDSEFRSAFRPVWVNYSLDYTAGYDSVAMQKSVHRAVGGVIHYTITARRRALRDEKTVEATFDMTADLTFGAPEMATLVLDDTHAYTVNTTSGVVGRADTSVAANEAK
jgi:hypothetical protein